MLTVNKKIPIQRLILVLAPVLAVAGALALYSLLPKDDLLLLEGAVEIPSATCFAPVSGRVESVLVQAGQRVERGQVLAALDDRPVDDQAALLRQTLAIKEARLQQLKTPLELDAQQAARRAAQDNVSLWRENLAQAQAALASARQALAEQQALYDAGTISRAELRQYEQAEQAAQSQTVTTQAQLSAAQNSVDAISLPTVDELAVAAAQADVGLTRLQIEQLERGREDYLIRAAADGVVLSSSLEAGATVAAGQGVFQLSSEDRQHAVFYLPQDCLSQVAFGDELPLFLQGSQEEAARGRVTYIDLQAVYPPEDYENDSNRNQRSVKIKVELTCGGPFAIGQPLFLRLAASRG